MLAQILSSIIFIASLVLIFSEKVHRTIISIVGAVLMVGIGMWLGFYNEGQAMLSIDYHTIGLLLGMMILVALLEPTGFFQFMAVWAGKLSRGRPIILLILLGSITTLISMFLDNVTTVVLIAPVTILICEIIGTIPVPFLMAEAILSDTGGTATLVGDPPNVLIASAAGFTFNDFLIHSLPIVLVAWFSALIMLRLFFRKELSVKPTNIEAVMEMNPRESLEDTRTIWRVLIVLGVAIILFFLQGWLKISTAFIALSAAAVALVWVRPDIKEILNRIEWGVLVFFIALFIIVGGLEKAGVFKILVGWMEGLIVIPPIIFGVILIWLVAGISAVVDNIPITIALIPVIQGLGAAGMNTTPLWWALVFGAGFGGNGTIIGSTANIVVVSLSERTRHPINSKLWNRTGLPVMLVTCVVASILYLIAYPLFSR